LQNILWKTET